MRCPKCKLRTYAISVFMKKIRFLPNYVYCKKCDKIYRVYFGKPQ